MIPRELVIAALGAPWLDGGALPATFDVSTDSRSIAPGQVFLALRGEHYDGHAFVQSALAAGAAGLIVSDASVIPAGVAAVVVPDTTVAYLALGAAARRRSGARFVGITGSAGKTTTKALLAQVLAHAAPGRVVATPANENNEIGVAKLLLSLTPSSEFVVVECGARRRDDIATLVDAVRPELSVLTNIGDAHLEIFGSRAALADAKWSIFRTGARPVLNFADPESRRRGAVFGDRAVWFGTGSDDDAAASGRTLVRVTAAGRETALVIDAPETRGRWPIDATISGTHNRANAAAAAAAAFALGLEGATIAAGLAEARLPPGRYERIAIGAYTIVFDAYNASPSGMLAALETFAAEDAVRRIAVLSSMAELGPDSPALHERVGVAAARAGLSALLVGGDAAVELARGARAGGMDPELIVPFRNNALAVAWLRANVRAGDVVLLKASRRYRLEEIVAGLTQAVHG